MIRHVVLMCFVLNSLAFCGEFGAISPQEVFDAIGPKLGKQCLDFEERSQLAQLYVTGLETDQDHALVMMTEALDKASDPTVRSQMIFNLGLKPSPTAAAICVDNIHNFRDEQCLAAAIDALQRQKLDSEQVKRLLERTDEIKTQYLWEPRCITLPVWEQLLINTAAASDGSCFELIERYVNEVIAAARSENERKERNELACRVYSGVDAPLALRKIMERNREFKREHSSSICIGIRALGDALSRQMNVNHLSDEQIERATNFLKSYVLADSRTSEIKGVAARRLAEAWKRCMEHGKTAQAESLKLFLEQHRESWEGTPDAKFIKILVPALRSDENN